MCVCVCKKNVLFHFSFGYYATKWRLVVSSHLQFVLSMKLSVILMLVSFKMIAVLLFMGSIAFLLVCLFAIKLYMYHGSEMNIVIFNVSYVDIALRWPLIPLRTSSSLGLPGSLHPMLPTG